MKENNHIFWRDEILQLLFWMRGEGMGESQSAGAMARFLNVEEAVLMQHLKEMLEAGYVRNEGGRFSLTGLGGTEGARRFREEFEPLLSQGHGECNDADCDCHELGPEHCEHREHPAGSRHKN